jgi:predicted TPR repeat methyltransferase
MEETWRDVYDEHLVGGLLGRVPGLVERLRAGARVLDLGCGTGHAVNVMAREMPADAGFRDVQVLDSPRPQNYIYLCRREQS